MCDASDHIDIRRYWDLQFPDKVSLAWNLCTNVFPRVGAIYSGRAEELPISKTKLLL